MTIKRDAEQVHEPDGPTCHGPRQVAPQLMLVLITKKERRRTRGGKNYLDIILADRTGRLGGKIWSESLEQLDPLFEAGQFAGVAGKVDSYQDERQLAIERIKGTHLIPLEQLEASHFDPGLLVPSSPLDPLELWNELLFLDDLEGKLNRE